MIQPLKSKFSFTQWKNKVGGYKINFTFILFSTHVNVLQIQTQL
jgi:hypothetical protein